MERISCGTPAHASFRSSAAIQSKLSPGLSDRHPISAGEALTDVHRISTQALYEFFSPGGIAAGLCLYLC